MQGLYRVRVGPVEVTESFVAAPGPMGWRYFGRGLDPVSGDEVYQVDLVVDRGWNLVRFRWSSSGAEAVAVPAEGGVVVRTGEGPSLVAGAEAAWSSSPVSLLVVDRLLVVSGRADVAAAYVGPGSEPRVRRVRVTPVDEREVATTEGTATVREVAVTVDDAAVRALIRADLPLRADGWFDLVG